MILGSCGTVVATCRPRGCVNRGQRKPTRDELRPLRGIRKEEMQQVDGVAAVVVDLEAGRVTVQGQGFSDEAVRAAVDEAGYEVVGA
jgi:hypothetical protein